jgi:hypothetical protein
MTTTPSLREPAINVAQVGSGDHGHIAVGNRTLCGEIISGVFRNSRRASCKHCIRRARRIARIANLLA